MISNKDGLEYLANIFIQEGIKDIVISPGSRNAPMMLTFPEYEEFKIYSIIDERSAAFFALGIAQKTRRPVVLNCTSGSALLNYAPAIAEAYYQQLPLIVLSADRPGKLIDQGDGQAIRQQNVYGNYIRESVHLPEQIVSENDVRNYQELIYKAVNQCYGPVMGPVQINVPLDEPIYGEKEKSEIKLLENNKQKQWFSFTEIRKHMISDSWSRALKKMIIVGQLPPNPELNKVLSKIAKRDDVVVLTETTSNVHSDLFVSKTDQTLTQINKENEGNFYPDLVISLGGHIVSKKIKAWLRNAKELEHWHISLDSQAPNVFFHLTEHIQTEEVFCLNEINLMEAASKPFQSLWLNAAEKANELQEIYCKQLPYSDLMVFRKLHKSLNGNYQLHFANSTPVRYSQFFDFGEDIIIDSNRGVSGIDGSVSTALGQSLCYEGQTILVTGDLSFFYDNNAFWNQYLHSDFKILLINNGGGGIFRFIDGPLNSGKIDLFETPHNRTAESIAKDTGMEYFCCSDEDELKPSIRSLLSSDKACVLEVFTPRETNDKVLKDYFKFLRNGHE